MRDNPEQLKIGKIESFIEKDTKQQRKEFREKRRAVFEWCKQKWDEISPSIDDWNLEELVEKWLIPFFTQFEYELEDFEIKRVSVDEDSPLRDFRITHQSKGYKNPFFHFVETKEDFDSKINKNPQKKAHHNVCQQFVNLNTEIRWLFLSNGRILRLLTKFYHVYSKGFLEFDLENIFANRDEKEFNAMYSTIHSSRFIPEEEDHEFLIEFFQKESTSEGIKIGDALRDNVHNAIELLGDELIQQNPNFMELVMTEDFDIEENYAELLRMIYRIIFILYAEQRKMLPWVGTLYFEQFSLTSFRFLAEKPIKAEKNFDLWKKLFITFQLVNKGNKFLGVNSYNGSLFKNDNLSIIINNKLKLSNDVLLQIIRKLTTSKINNVLQRINFLEITEEEIGVVYESLLDFKPYIDSNSQFQLIEGTERKSTGSYYTPKALIDILIRTTLQPLVEDRLKEAGDDKDEKEKAILNLKVCDPACGGGTFLLAALDYLGKKLAEVRTGSDYPLEDDLREARREILQHCIYGVDMNPLAVELAKMSLWLRACVKDKPLNFLDNHIKCGNSLIGLGQKMEINEINPNAFEAISGNKATGIAPENKKLKSKAREIIKNEIRERRIQGKTTLITSFFTERRTADICSTKFQEIIDMPENDPENINQKENLYEDLRKNENYQQALSEANIWTSTFFWPLEGDVLGEIPRYTTIEQLRENIADPELDKLMEKINKLAVDNQFFHWYIEFPEVFSNDRGGFDCILTNPPWEILQLKEKEFFMGLSEEILAAQNQSKRRLLIKNLKNNNPSLFERYMLTWRNVMKINNYFSKSKLYSLSAKGTLNTYALFTERNWDLINTNGYAGIICPTGIIMNYHMQDLFKALIQKKTLQMMFDFVNTNKIFNIATKQRFCLLMLGNKSIFGDIIPMTFYSLNPEDIQKTLSIIYNSNQKTLRQRIIKLPDYHFLIPLEQKDFELFNPNTLTCPSFHNKKEADLLRHLYEQAPILIKKDVNTRKVINNPWKISFNRMFDAANDSKMFISKMKLKDLNAKPINRKSTGGIYIDSDGKKYYPLYDGKIIWQYDHRYSSIELISETKAKRKMRPIHTSEESHSDIWYSILPAYWIKEEDFISKFPKNYTKNWLIGYRNITDALNERTFVATIIPKTPTLDPLPLILSEFSANDLCLLLANLNSIVFDFIVRLKTMGLHISFFILEQLPIFTYKDYDEDLKKIIVQNVLKLTYTSMGIESFAKDLGFEGKPFKWDLNERMKLKSELDAIYAHLYKLDRNSLSYILDTFPILKKYELEKFEVFLTKKLVLKAYDKFSKKKELFE